MIEESKTIAKQQLFPSFMSNLECKNFQFGQWLFKNDLYICDDFLTAWMKKRPLFQRDEKLNDYENRKDR